MLLKHKAGRLTHATLCSTRENCVLFWFSLETCPALLWFCSHSLKFLSLSFGLDWLYGVIGFNPAFLSCWVAEVLYWFVASLALSFFLSFVASKSIFNNIYRGGHTIHFQKFNYLSTGHDRKWTCVFIFAVKIWALWNTFRSRLHMVGPETQQFLNSWETLLKAISYPTYMTIKVTKLRRSIGETKLEVEVDSAPEDWCWIGDSEQQGLEGFCLAKCLPTLIQLLDGGFPTIYPQKWRQTTFLFKQPVSKFSNTDGIPDLDPTSNVPSQPFSSPKPPASILLWLFSLVAAKSSSPAKDTPTKPLDTDSDPREVRQWFYYHDKRTLTAREVKRQTTPLSNCKVGQGLLDVPSTPDTQLARGCVAHLF